MEQSKKGIFTFLHVFIWLMFISAINDPRFVGGRTPESIYSTYAFLVDPLYSVGEWIMAPIKGLLGLFGLSDAMAGATWFPYTSAPEWHNMVQGFGLGGVFTPNAFEGAIVWWVPISSVTLYVASIAFDAVYEPVRNWVWNVVIEYVFQRKKTRMYAQALEKRESDMARLSTQYRALAQETHSLKDSVITDELTNVFNKRFFLNKLQQEFDACKRQRQLMSLIMIDIDFFKKLNDTYGHLSGDHVLKAVAEVIKRFVPDLCYPCRYGGEEFAVIMPKKNVEQAVEAARLIQEHVQLLRFENIDPKLRVSVSQGICTVNFAIPEAADIKSYDTILQIADEELYRSKIQGRNRVSVKSLLTPKAEG